MSLEDVKRRLRRIRDEIILTDEGFIKKELDRIDRELRSIDHDIYVFRKALEWAKPMYARCPVCGTPITEEAWKMRIRYLEWMIEDLERRKEELERRMSELWKALEKIQLKRRKSHGKNS